MAGFLSKLFGGDANQSDLQEQVDAIAREERARRESQRSLNPDEESIWAPPKFEEADPADSAEESESGEPIVVGGLLGNLLNMAGLGNLNDLSSSTNPWMAHINRVNQSLTPAQREQAIERALNNLPPESRATLEQRLTEGSQEFSVGLKSELVSLLEEPNGVLALMERITPGDSNSGHLDIMGAMQDPAIRDLVKTLLPELFRAKQESD